MYENGILMFVKETYLTLGLRFHMMCLHCSLFKIKAHSNIEILRISKSYYKCTPQPTLTSKPNQREGLTIRCCVSHPVLKFFTWTVLEDLAFSIGKKVCSSLLLSECMRG